MNFVLYQSAIGDGELFLMDEGSARDLLAVHAEQDERAAAGNFYGAECLDEELDSIWQGATVLEQTRDKRAIASLKQQYKEVC